MSNESAGIFDHATPPEGAPVMERQPSMIGTPSVPLAEPVPESGAVAPIPAPEGEPVGPSIPALPIPGLPPILPQPGPPFPFPHFCFIFLLPGCYRITYRPNSGFLVYQGTMRVDIRGGTTTISGDLYQFLRLPPIPPQPLPTPRPVATVSPALRAVEAGVGPTALPLPFPLGIPIYPRSRYHSYLKVTGIQRPPIFTSGPCRLTLTAQEYLYTQPPAGMFNGTFPAAPGTRTVTIELEHRPPPAGFGSVYFEGTLLESGVAQGSFTMGWVSPFFRRAHLEIDTLQGAVAPQAVPSSTGGTEDLRSVFASAGWDLTVTYDQTNIPIPWRPGGPTPNASACWTSNDLHDLMSTVRNPATNLDAEWRMHLIVVPAAMGCGRGSMYDTIVVPREGVASFCDDGYPTNECATFGTAANQQQRNVPRAFLRSASHEVGHGFNQIHQEQEAGADNSIMTTTPSVCAVLGGPTTGAPGVFPDDINLAFNDHVRHHLVHFPDPVVRPGGMTFGSGHISTVPEADRRYFLPDEVSLDLELAEDHIDLGEPLVLRWRLTNHTSLEVPTPTDIGLPAQHAFITVTNPRGRPRLMPSFVIQTEQVTIAPLAPGGSLAAETRVFWSSQGFAFEEPGRYEVEVRIVWTAGGVPFGVRASAPVWVNYPQSDLDNETASTLLHPEVGMYVALGGGAGHLTEAVDRLGRVAAPEGDRPAPRALRGFGDILPGGGRGASTGGRRRSTGRSTTRGKRR